MRMLAFGQPQPLPAPGPTRRDHLHPCSMPERPQAWSPCSRGRVRRPQWTPRSDSLPDTACPVVSGRTPSPPPGTPWRTRSDADRERTNGTEGTRTSSIATSAKAARRDTPNPAVGPAFAAWQTKAGSAMATLPAPPTRNHGSDQAATWYRSTVQAAPRRTALLRRLRVERRANGDASSVMASPL